MGCYSSNDSADLCCFRHHHGVQMWSKHRRLINIFYNYLHCCHVTEGPQTQETRINMQIGCFYPQGIACLSFKIQLLYKQNYLEILFFSDVDTKLFCLKLPVSIKWNDLCHLYTTSTFDWQTIFFGSFFSFLKTLFAVAH